MGSSQGCAQHPRVIVQSLIEPSRRILDDCPQNRSPWSANSWRRECHHGSFIANKGELNWASEQVQCFGAQPHLCSSGYTSHCGEGWPRYYALLLTREEIACASRTYVTPASSIASFNSEYCVLSSSWMDELRKLDASQDAVQTSWSSIFFNSRKTSLVKILKLEQSWRYSLLYLEKIYLLSAISCMTSCSLKH